MITACLLGAPVAIAAPSPLAERLRHELRDLLVDGADSAPRHSLRLGDDGRTEGGRASGAAIDPVQNALAEITSYAVARSPMLCVHAGVVATAYGLVAIPGRSGHGKTTLVAALVRAGFGYVSDEVLAVDRTSLAVTAFPRPLALDRRSCDCLGLDPARAPDLERLIAPADLGTVSAGGRVSDIVLSTRRAGEVVVTSATHGEVVSTLLAHAFNHYADGPSSFRAAVSLARGARAWRVEYAEATDLAAALATHFDVC